MCPPDHFGVEYVINPWMDGNIGKPDLAEAGSQWAFLRSTLSEYAEILEIESAEHLPDMVFTANAGFVCGSVFVPSSMRFAERRREQPFFECWFREQGLELLRLRDDVFFEGEGDVLLQLGLGFSWGGYGVRSTLDALVMLRHVLQIEIECLRLESPTFYHLDTCFCPLPHGYAMLYPDAFDPHSVDTVRRRLGRDHVIEVGSEDAFGFACNAVVLGRNIVMNHVSSELRQRLAGIGLTSVVCPVTQFMLAGGAAKCLVLRMEQAR